MKIFLVYFLACLTLYANDQSRENDTSDSNAESEESGWVEEIIEVIAEASLHNPDFGKDIGDR